MPESVRVWSKYQLGYKRVREIARQRGIYTRLPWGVNLFGGISGASGLSEASRGVAASLQGAEIPVSICDFLKADWAAGNCAPYQVNLVHANPNQLPELVYLIPKKQWTNRYNIGFWVWEQEQLPKEWRGFFPLFDEIWTPSQFTAAAIQRETVMPVKVVPHLMDVKLDNNCSREMAGLPQNIFLSLIMFDCESVKERKNPEGAIAAFKMAFEDRKQQVGLIIKARNLTKADELNLRLLLDGWPNVFIIAQDYTKKEVNDLIQLADVYLSLHRAEGFGLILAEAMSLGTPVIATNWSGNTEFMNQSVACMVDAELVVLKQDYPPFHKGSRWAEPDISQAAMHLRNLYENQRFRKTLADRASVFITDKLGIDAISGLIAARMEEIKKSLE